MFDVTVIGAGVEGSATAFTLAGKGKKTLLLEQFTLPHTRGSSHGQTRIIRKAYTKKHYAEMMDEAYQRWISLEKEVGKELFVKNVGLLCYADSTAHDQVESTTSALANLGEKYERLTVTQMRQRFPLLSFENDEIGVFDPTAGVLRADASVRAYQDAFVRRGGVLKDDTRVVDIVPGATIKLRTTRGEFTTNKLVICAGSWAPVILRSLGLNLPLQVKDGYSSKNVPNLVRYSAANEHKAESLHYFATQPDLEYPGLMKVALHHGPDIDPNIRDARAAARDDSEESLKLLIKKRIPGLEASPSVEESCIYTMTPDEDFILDRHPRWSNIVIGAGFSGHGFKLSPVVGKVLSEIALNEKPSYSLEPFKISRFGSSKL